MKLTFYDWLLLNGVDKDDAFTYLNLYCFGGTVSDLQEKILIQCYELYRKGGK